MSTPQEQLQPQSDIDLSDAIEQLRIKKGIPKSLVDKLVNQESGGRESAVSPKGAQGSFQVMPATFDLYNKKVGGKLRADNPLDRAYVGLSLLQDNYKQFKNYAKSEPHNWGMALAAYHGNPDAVMRDLRRGGNGIPDQNDGLINTRDYVYNILSGVDLSNSGQAAQEPKTPQVTSTVKELDSQQEIPAGQPQPPTQVKPITFQLSGPTRTPTINPVESLSHLTEETEVQPRGLRKLQSREYQAPSFKEVGERIKLSFPHGAPTEDDVVQSYLSSLGPEYVQLGERYKSETGHNILTLGGGVKQEDDGSFSIRPTRGAVDFINAYAKGGLGEALPLAERQRREFIKAQEDARLRAQPTVERARRAVEAEKQSPVSRGILTFGAGPVQAGGTLLGPAGGDVRRFAEELRAVGEQAQKEKPLGSLPKSEQIEYGVGALLPTAATLAISRGLGAAQLPVLGALEGQTLQERVGGALSGAAMQAAMGPLPSQLGESLPDVAKKAVAGPTLAAIPTAQAVVGGEPITSALVQNAPFALLPVLEKGQAPERPTELGIERAQTAGVPGEATANIDQRLAERESKVQPTFLRDDQGQPVARVLNPDEVAQGAKPKVRAIHQSDIQARDESGKFTQSIQPNQPLPEPLVSAEPSVEGAPQAQSSPAQEITHIAPDTGKKSGNLPTSSDEPSTTSARKAQVDVEREARGAEPLPWRPESKSDVTLLESAKKANADRPEQPRQLVDEVLTKPRALSDKETVQIDLRKQELKNEHNQLLREIAETDNPDVLAEKRAQLEAIEKDFDDTDRAWRLSGTEKGRGLRSQQVTINQDFDLVSMLTRYKAKTGKEPLPEIRKEIEGYQKRIADLEKQAADREVQPAVQKLQREVRRERRQVTKKVLDDEAATIKQNIAAEFQRLKSQQSSTHSLWGLGSLDPEGVITREALKYVRNRVEAGVADTAQLIDDVHGLLSEFIDGVTKRQVAEMISGYGRPTQQTRSELQKQLDTLKSQMRAELKQADVDTGIMTARRQGPPETKRTIERRYQKQIDEIDRRMREMDFAPKAQRGPIVLDAETQKIADRLEAAKNQYQNFVLRNSPGAGWRNLAGIRKAWLLSGLKTHLRNIGGTGLYQPFDEISRLPAVLFDMALPGERSISGPSPVAVIDSIVHAAKVGRREAGEILKHGATREDMARHQYQEINTGVKAIDVAHNAIFRFMSASDRVFYQGAYKRNLIDRALVEAKNERRADPKVDVRARARELADNPTKELEASAKHDALVNTFNNNNKLSDAIKRARSGFGPATNFAVDLVMPFDRTPTNVVARVLEASPAGFVKAATGGYRTARIDKIARSIIDKSMTREEKRQFVQAAGRATAGTVLIGLGWALAPKVLDADDRGNVFLKAGRQRINVNQLSPVGNLFALGAKLRREHDNESLTAGSAAKIAGRVPLDQPLLRAGSQITEIVRDPERSVGKVGASTAFGFVPFSGAVRFAGETIDPAENRYADPSFKQQFQRNIPKWREGLSSERKGDFKKRLMEGMRKGEWPDLDALVESERITPSEKSRLEREIELTPPQVRFENAPNDKALDRYERMSEAQRVELRDIMERKGWTLTHSDSLTESQKEGFRKRLDALGIEPRLPQRTNNFAPSFRTRFTGARP